MLKSKNKAFFFLSLTDQFLETFITCKIGSMGTNFFNIFNLHRFELGMLARIFHPGLLTRFLSGYFDMLTNALSLPHNFRISKVQQKKPLLSKYLDQLQTFQQ